MEAQARALEEEVRQLCEQEQNKQTALLKQRLYSRVGQFLMGNLDMRHWWCGYSPLMVFMMRILELYPASESVCVFYKRMEQQLGACRKCVDIYHASMPSVHVELEYEFTPESIYAFFVKLQGLDADRVQRQLTDKSMGTTSVLRETSETITLTLYEVLSQRRLLSDFRILRVLGRWASSPFSEVNANPSLKSLRGSAGLYQLLVSSDAAVKEWAQKMVAYFGKIQLSGDYGEDKYFLDVMEEWMYVLENDAFNKPLLSLDLRSTEDLQDFLEPTNCIKTPTKKALWSALDHVMQHMDIDSLETMLDSFDTIPGIVFNYLQQAEPSGDQTVTLVVSKCFAVLLRCLGHRFWNHCEYSPEIVLDVIMQHCHLAPWRVYVTKQFVELLPPLLASMRPPQVSNQEAYPKKLKFYLKTRSDILRFLIVEDLRPKHYDSIVIIAMSRAAFTILGDCYEHRMPGSVNNKLGSGRDEGALSESISIDYSVSESAFWWPCGSGSNGDTNDNLEKLWMKHLSDIVVRPNNVESLVDLAAETTALILSKHLQLARDVVYSNIGTNNETLLSIEALTKGKPIITDLLRKLCSWNTITTIPLQVHGALFESIGGISELLNSIDAQMHSDVELHQITDTLRKYEAQTQQYLQKICDEVLLKGLANPFGFPVVSQHISACYLSPTSSIDQQVKRLISHYAADKRRPSQVPSPLEALLISVHRNAEAFLRGQLSMLQSMRLYGFSQAVCLPAVKKLIFVWSRVFDMLGGDLEKAFQKASNVKATSTSSHQVTDTGIAATHLLKLPSLINDFLIVLLTSLFNPKTRLTVEIAEATRVQCLDFGISFWKFWTSNLKDSNMSSKRVTGLISPLIECITRGSSSENKRAAELLMTILRCLLKGNTRLDEATLTLIDSIKGETVIESKQSTDFGRMTKKFRQLDQTLTFFTKRSLGPSSMNNFVDMTARTKSKLPPTTKPSASLFSSTIRPMSGKSAARAQSRNLVDLTGVEEVSNEAAARKQHSFYSEEEYRTPSQKELSPKGQSSKAKTPFDMAQVIKGMSHSHPGSSKAIRSDRSKQQTNGSTPEQLEEEEEEDSELQFAALFHRIKTTRKPVAVCSLLPFYRELLQVCMPVLLSGEFQNERSDKELQAPGLSFKKSADYVRAFLPLLLEECNNEVQEGLRKCSYGSGGHVLRYESEKSREGMRCISFSIVQKDEGLLASSQSKLGNKGQQRRVFNEKLFRNGDVVLLQISVGSQAQIGLMGKREFLGVISVSETEKGRRQTSSTKKSSKNEEEESIKVLFLNDGELDNATASVRSFSTEILAANAIADSEWKVNPLCNLVTSAREYIALRSVDMLPEHLRTTILTPEAYKSTQSELITITAVLDDLRGDKSSGSCSKIKKLLKRLDRMDVMLTDLRSTSIGKAVNKLRKHDDTEVKDLSAKLKVKWTSLMDKKDALERAPRFLSAELWEAIKPQYNSSQLQSIHSVMNNYSMGVSLLQGPPGTGKTKTIMGLLSGLLSLRLPATAAMPMITPKNSSSVQGSGNMGDFNNFEAARSRSVNTAQTGGQSSRTAASTFSLSGVQSALGSILRRSSDPSSAGPSRTSIQSLKNAGSSRSRLENKLSNRTNHASSNLVVKRRVISRVSSERSASRTNNILLCAPSNGAVNELVLRIVTDGLMDSSGNVTNVRAPSVHPEALSEERISIVRLGNAGEDASKIVNSVCLPHIIRREMAIHPKAMQLQSLQDTQRQLRSSIRDFHNKSDDGSGQKKDRKALAQMHQQLTECSGKIRRLRDEVTAIRSKMTESILSKANIIACTLSKAGSGDFSELKHGFDALIIDEAAQAVELSTLVPIRERVARVVLVGDPKQLPATVKSVIAANARYDRSLFERIADSGVAPSMLRVQYRMHPFLRDFPSKRFYGGMLTDGPSVMERVRKVCPGVYAHTSFQPFLLYDIGHSQEQDMNGSKYNRVEAAFCISLCQNMFESCADVRKNKWSVGFVSPYKEQVRVLRQEITRSGIPTNVSIEVNTVDGFQGREKDVIIFSCVRSSKRGGIGFLRDIRRLNVAITRARFCLYVVGDVNTLVRDETWAALVKSARDRKLIIRTEGEAFPSVVKRLEGDKYRELAGHFKSMHQKVAQKSTSTVISIKTNTNNSGDAIKAELKPVEKTCDVIKADLKPVEKICDIIKAEQKPVEKICNVIKAELQQVENICDGIKAELQPVEKTCDVKTETSNSKMHSVPQSEEEVANDRKVSVGGKDYIKPESRLTNSLDHSEKDHKSKQPTHSHKRPWVDSHEANMKKLRTYATEPRSVADLQGQHKIRSFRDRNSSSMVDSHRRDDYRFRERGAVQRRKEHTDLSRREVRHDRSRDYRSSHDHRERSDRGSEGTQSNRYGDDRRDQRRNTHTDARRSSRSPSVSFTTDTPQSISEKEFCQANEPPRPSKTDRMRSNIPQMRGKRPYQESSYPPTHPGHRNHDQSSYRHDNRGNSYRTVTNESSSRRNQGSVNTTATRSTNVLGNILGTAKKLASSTKRVSNNNPRSSEFS